jgi:hypothetical protein
MIETQRENFPLPKDPRDPEFHRRWTFFAKTYRGAMERYVQTLLRARLRRPPDSHEVEDVVSGFIETAMDKGSLGWDEATPIESFRRFLAWRLRNYTLNHLRKSVAARRDPLLGAVGADLDRLAVAEDDPAELLAFDEGIVKIAVDRALARLRTDCREDLLAEVIADLLATNGEGSEAFALRIGRDASQMRRLRYDARQAFQGLLLRELRNLCRTDREYWELLDELDPILP